jgi:hypothetical protein
MLHCFTKRGGKHSIISAGQYDSRVEPTGFMDHFQIGNNA